MIQNKNVTEWDESYRKALIDQILRTFKELGVSFHSVKKIFVVGSRIYKEFGNIFNEKSDLNLLIFTTRSVHQKLLENKKLPIKISFHGIPTIIYVYPIDDLTKVLGNYNNLSLPYYDLINKKYYSGNKLDLIDYLRNIKGRLRLKRICFICGQEQAESIIKMEYHEQPTKVMFKKTLDICKDCFNKFIGRNFQNLSKYLKED